MLNKASGFIRKLDVLVSPPLPEVAFGVVLSTHIIKAVRNLVAYHSADAAVVKGPWIILAEKWRLQNTSREHDAVERRAVVCVEY